MESKELTPEDLFCSYFSGEKSFDEMFKDLADLFIYKPKEPTISQLKKWIKHCKNPLEKKQLERKLNELYKERKKCK